jgi:hypothetical protein
LGAGSRKQIFYAEQATIAAMQIAQQFHPAWNRCSTYAKQLHGRNAFQILGLDLDQPSRFLVCWTSDGCESHASKTIDTGGTGTAISIADHYGVEIINIGNPSQHDRIVNFI